MTAPAASSPPGLPRRRRTAVHRTEWGTVDDTGPGGPRDPHRPDRTDRTNDVDVDVDYMVRLP